MFPNSIKDKETGVHYLEQAREIGNKILLAKHDRKPVAAKRINSKFFLMYILLKSWYSHTNSCVEVQKDYRSILVIRCRTKNAKEILL
jgi:hypothetical protein